MAERRRQVQVLRKLARNHGIAQVADNASRDCVKTMVRSLVGLSGLPSAARDELERLWDACKHTFPDWEESQEEGVEGDGHEEDEEPEAEEGGEGGREDKAWFFRAVQLRRNLKVNFNVDLK